jgi:hypothetical protein
MKRLYDPNHISRLHRGKKFTWVSHRGEAVALRDMNTLHMFYALRMIFNHTSPIRVGKFIAYADVPTWSLSYRRAAMRAFVDELIPRLGELGAARREFFLIVGMSMVQNLI